MKNRAFIELSLMRFVLFALIELFLIGLMACRPENRILKPIEVNETPMDQREMGPEARIDPNLVKASIMNAPEGETRQTTHKIEVEGEDLSHFFYKVGPAEQVNCSEENDYILKNVDQLIEIGPNGFPDGEIRLCVVGRHRTGVLQPYASASIATWQQVTSRLSSPEGFISNSSSQQISLYWQRPEQTRSFLLLRSPLPIQWQPENGRIYEVGPVADQNIEVLLNANELVYLDQNVLDGRSYYYQIYAYDIEFRYSEAASLAAIPSARPFAWVNHEVGAYLKDAVVGGTLENDAGFIFVCRGVRLDQNGQIQGRHPGKFIPTQKNDLSHGECVYTFGTTAVSAERFEILVLTRGRFDEFLAWTATTSAQNIPANALRGGDEISAGVNIDLYLCRFADGPNNLRIPGKFFAGTGGCHGEGGAGYRIVADFEILTVKI